MMERANLGQIKKIIQSFLEKTTLELEVQIMPQNEKALPVKIKTKEPKILIGEHGQTLLDIQHILNLIVKKKTEEEIYIDVDINDYKKKKQEYLKELARSVADEAVLTKTEKILQPMSAYERRIIHVELADRQDVTTESVGEEPERRVKIRVRP